ncbi:MAG: glycosyltransferase [Candidatus Omnitrophica bacterium]|nr:glycosyltransferase [Candidatus Omnitrophota bacterium]
MGKRVLILHISSVGGHSKAAQNLKEALLFKDKDISVTNLNIFGHFYPKTEKIVDFVYTNVIKYFPFLWGKIYDRKTIVKNLNPFWRRINKFSFKKIANLLNDSKPDCILTTQAFPCGIISSFKEYFKIKIPLVAIVTDYYPHRFWIHVGVDKYIVASKEAKDILVHENVLASKIEVIGIPISIKFLVSHDRYTIAQTFGFRKDLKTVLIMGGGLGLGPIREISKALEELDKDFQVIIICGANSKLFNWFEKNKKYFKKPLFHFGYVDFVNKIMDFSDIIITKGGGITISEALAKGLAIIITNPIPGQEERNVNFLLSKDAVIREDNIFNISKKVEILLKDDSALNYFKQRAKSISCSDSSTRIADLILKMI